MLLLIAPGHDNMAMLCMIIFSATHGEISPYTPAANDVQRSKELAPKVFEELHEDVDPP